jgi:hypothetical protein
MVFPFARTGRVLAALVALRAAPPALAQHDHHRADTSHVARPMNDAHAPGSDAEDHSAHAPHAGHTMQSALHPGDAMGADGSGSGWIPTGTAPEMLHGRAGAWSLMLHGAAFPRVTAQDALGSGTRGSTAVGAPNWLMGGAQRALGARAQVTLRAMVSLDPLTESGDGYPLLFQTGETFAGEPLVDRQHPHDALTEISATVARRVGSAASVFASVAYPGEPALGPVAFMHRPSARFGPDAPLSHHWQDATHIVWGVATGGVVAGPLKLDASLFTGAEPDEDRWTPEPPTFNSASVRLSVRPAPQWVLQVSRAHLTEPEALEPGDVTRTTASALFGAALGADRDLSASLVWGRNEGHADEAAKVASGGDGPQDAFLVEAALRAGRLATFLRGERVDKSGEALGLSGEPGEATYAVHALSLGGSAAVAHVGPLGLHLGGQATAYAVPEALRPAYGRAPVSLQIFLRLAPRAMTAH